MTRRRETVNHGPEPLELVPGFRADPAAIVGLMSPPRYVYRLLPPDAWEKAVRDGRFIGSEHDVRDGFIHFSTAAQVAETAARHYAQQTPLLLLWVETSALGDALRFEPSRGGALFPHLYAALPVSAVVRVDSLSLAADGAHQLPTLDLR